MLLDNRKPLDILISYFYAAKTNLRDFQAIFKQRPFVIADSGGFSAHSLGEEVDIAKYADWLHEWSDVVDIAANLDIKGDVRQSERNLRYLEGRGLGTVMPVFHGGEDLGLLREMVESYPVVFLGNMTTGVPTTHPKTRNFLDKVFSIADGKAGIHGFGLTNTKTVKAYPWWSVDSTTWKIGSRYGMISRYDRESHTVKSVKLGSKDFADRANEWAYMTGLDWRDYGYRNRLDGIPGKLYHYAKPSLAAFEIFRHVEHKRRGEVPAEGYPPGLHLCYATQPTMTGTTPTDPEALQWVENADLRI